MNDIAVTKIARPRLTDRAGPMQIVPPKSHIARGLFQSSTMSPTAILNDHGGPILTAVEVVPIYWGAAWGQGSDAQLASDLDAFFDSVLASSMMDMLAEYGRPTEPIGHGTRAASFRITNSEPGSIVSGARQVTDEEIQTALQGWISAGTVTATTSNTLYFIYLPVGVKSFMGSDGSCMQYCGYHNHINETTFYAVIPYANCPGCEFSGPFLDTLTEVSSHELCEAITDPALNAWWDSNGGEEIGDICNRQTVRLNGYMVQTEWSNQQNACVIAPTGTPTSMFHAVYAQGDPGNGIGGYDLKSPADQAFAFDFDSSGKLDHIALYRPGTGTFWILRNQAGAFTPLYHQGDPGDGIGGYDLKSPADRAFAFDYDGSGKLDHVALYRPATGTFWILRNQGGAFTPVYQQGDPGNGIGGYDLKSPVDQAFAFDFDSSGKQDHIALYRPGTGTFWILQNQGGAFTPVYQQGDPGNGIGGYDLKSPADRAFAFDYDGSRKLDHVALYRPGTGTFWILQNRGGAFAPVYREGDPGNGIGGYDLKSPGDRAFAYDFDGSGKLDHIALYRPGTGTIWILANQGGAFSAVYHQGDPGLGIGGYDLKSPADRAFAFDYSSSGKMDSLALCRPGTGTFWILEK